MRPDEDVGDHGDRPRDRDHVPGDEVAAGVARDQPVVDGDGREEQQVDDRVAEPPEDVLRQQRTFVSPTRSNDCMICHEQPRERQRRDDHVDGDHRRAGSPRTAPCARCVANVRGQRKPRPNETPSRLPIEPETSRAPGPFVTMWRIARHQVRSRGPRAARRRRRGRSPSRPSCPTRGRAAGRGRPTTPPKPKTSVVTITPMTPSTISHQVSARQRERRSRAPGSRRSRAPSRRGP